MNPAIHALSLYLDTSVIGGYYDAEFIDDTRALWRLRDAGRFRFVSSVNLLQGYPPLRIVAPAFLIHGHEEKDL